MRRFKLLRHDTSGAGATGEGVVFEDGATVIRWYGLYPFTVMWAEIDEAVEVYGHDGATELVWLDGPKLPGPPAGRPLRLLERWEGGDDA